LTQPGATPDFTTRVHEFAAVAREFVALLGARPLRSADDVLFALDDLLPRMYVAGGRLAAAAPDSIYEDVAEQPADPSEDEAGLNASQTLEEELITLLGESDRYHIVEYLGANVEDYDIEERSFALDLSDMHAMLREQLALYDTQQPDAIESSGRGWLQSFEGLWGPNLPFMLAALNRHVYGTLTEAEVDAAEDAENAPDE
jgi:hypothetical protein